MSLDDFDIQSERDHSNRCKYLLSQIKQLDKNLWRTLNGEFQEISSDETWNFSRKLIETYQPLQKANEEMRAKQQSILAC